MYQVNEDLNGVGSDEPGMESGPCNKCGRITDDFGWFTSAKICEECIFTNIQHDAVRKHLRDVCCGEVTITATHGGETVISVSDERISSAPDFVLATPGIAIEIPWLAVVREALERNDLDDMTRTLYRILDAPIVTLRADDFEDERQGVSGTAIDRARRFLALHETRIEA